MSCVNDSSLFRKLLLPQIAKHADDFDVIALNFVDPMMKQLELPFDVFFLKPIPMAAFLLRVIQVYNTFEYFHNSNHRLQQFFSHIYFFVIVHLNRDGIFLRNCYP